MTPQEREVIDSIFERLKPAASHPRDPEAERHIAELMRQQPYATYVLAQSAYVQEQALGNLAQENEQLKARLADAERKAAEPASGGFLSSIFGGGAAPARPGPRPAFAPQGQPQGGMGQAGMGQGGMGQGGMGQGSMGQGGPWGQQPQQGGMAQGGPWGGAQAGQPAQRGGSGFLGTALTTAAGVAGGMVVGNMLMNAFKGDSAGTGAGSGAQSASAAGETGPQSNDAMAANNYADEGNRYDDAQEAGYDDGYDGYDGGGDSYDV